MRKQVFFLSVIAIVLPWMACTSFAGQTIYVNADAAGNNDGSSWANAYNYLQDALSAASSGDEIWVAEGIYKPDQGKNVKTGDRSATFRLKNGVAIYGGFPARGGNLKDRNPNVYETILSGDLNSDDVEVAKPADLPDEPTRVENSYHVVTSRKTDTTAVLNGFIIIAGTSEGGGILNDAGSPKVVNCTFSGHASNVGSAMSNRKNSKPNIINCVFSGNWASWGGSMTNSDSAPNITGCIFEGNSGETGGALSNSWCSPTFTNCTFSGNYASDCGGAMRNYYSSPTFIICTFSANLTSGHGGVMYNYNGGPILVNCTLTGNSARKFGGGIANSKSKPALINCIITGNSATLAGGIHNTNRSNPTLTNCILWGNRDNDGAGESAQIFYGSEAVVNYCCIQGWTGVLGGEGSIDADPLFVKPGHWDRNGTMEDATDDFWVDGDYHLSAGSPCIDAGDNSAVPSSLDADLDGRPRFEDGDGDGTAIVDMGAYEAGR